MSYLEWLFQKIRNFAKKEQKKVAKNTSITLEEKKPKNSTRDSFYQKLRESGLFDKLRQSQVDGINFILDGWDKSGLQDKRWLAYMLATTYHETARTMLPIKEYGKGKGRPYGRKIKMNRTPYTKPDKLYYGRGYVQLTWYENYDKMGKYVGADLLNLPELALEPEIAFKIMLEGMVRGTFTGKSLGKYFNEEKNDPYRARRIINGMDKATKIKEYHLKFLDCLS